MNNKILLITGTLIILFFQVQSQYTYEFTQTQRDTLVNGINALHQSASATSFYNVTWPDTLTQHYLGWSNPDPEQYQEILETEYLFFNDIYYLEIQFGESFLETQAQGFLTQIQDTLLNTIFPAGQSYYNVQTGMCNTNNYYQQKYCDIYKAFMDDQLQHFTIDMSSWQYFEMLEEGGLLVRFIMSGKTLEQTQYQYTSTPSTVYCQRCAPNRFCDETLKLCSTFPANPLAKHIHDLVIQEDCEIQKSQGKCSTDAYIFKHLCPITCENEWFQLCPDTSTLTDCIAAQANPSLCTQSLYYNKCFQQCDRCNRNSQESTHVPSTFVNDLYDQINNFRAKVYNLQPYAYVYLFENMIKNLIKTGDVQYNYKNDLSRTNLKNNQNEEMSYVQTLEYTVNITANPTLNVTTIVNSWTNQQQYYDYDTNTCQSGHDCSPYLQIVSGTTTVFECEVGFPNFYPQKEIYFVVCAFYYGRQDNLDRPYGEYQGLNSFDLAKISQQLNRFRVSDEFFPKKMFEVQESETLNSEANTLVHSCDNPNPQNETSNQKAVLFYRTNVYSENINNDALDAWFAERQYYNITSNTCQSGHLCSNFTGMMWWSATQFGCAKHRCPQTQQNDAFTLFACKLSQAKDHTVGVVPFIKGSNIQELASECSSTSRTHSWKRFCSLTIPEECNNFADLYYENGYCQEWDETDQWILGFSMCDAEPGYAQSQCRLYCNDCNMKKCQDTDPDVFDCSQYECDEFSLEIQFAYCPYKCMKC